MLKLFRRLFVIYRKFSGRLIISQILLFISALRMIGIATLNQVIFDDGITAQDPEIILETGIMMTFL